MRFGNLEPARRGSNDQRQPIGGIEDVLEVAETVVLGRMVVQRIGAAIRRFDAQVVPQHVARYEIVQVAGDPPYSMLG